MDKIFYVVCMTLILNGFMGARADAASAGAVTTPRAQPDRIQSISLRIIGNDGCAGLPLKGGVPFPRGMLTNLAQLALTTPAGTAVPFHAAPVNHWPDQSVKWILLDTVIPSACHELQLRWPDSAAGPDSAAQRGLLHGLLRAFTGAAEELAPLARENPRRIVVDTGALRAEISKARFGLLNQALCGGRTIIDGDTPRGAYMEDENGTRYYAQNDPGVAVVLEENNPLRACIRAEGWHIAASGARLGRFVTRMHFYRDQSFIRVFHTFIITENSNARKYRDIGMELPLAGRMAACTFDQDSRRAIDPAGAPYLVQYTLDENLLFDGERRTPGKRADGWLHAVTDRGAAMGIAARDFRQQFPKELGVSGNALVYHFWPRHGRPRTVVTPATINHDNALQLWNVHEGELLDFTYPAFYLDCFSEMKAVTRFGDEMVQAFDLAPQINALGVAKTHEFIVWCGADGDSGERMPALSDYLNRPPALAVDPAWFAGTRVFGPFGVMDRSQRPEVEKFFDDGAAGALAVRDMLGDYGMFNFGDTHHAIDFKRRVAIPYRYWYNTHHNMPRWPWLQFARTGDERCLRWGVPNIRHVMDVDHCHYATPEAQGQSDFRLKKLPGGVCDYKGLAHWSAGGRFCYNSVADALLNYYYITGDRRGRDVALLHGQGILAHPPRAGGREGAGICASLIALCQETGEPAYREMLDKFIAGMLKSQNQDGNMEGRAPHWTPWLERYVEMTGDAAAREALVRWADYFIRKDDPGEWQRMGSYYNLFAYAWRITGKPEYLKYAQNKLNEHIAKARLAKPLFGDQSEIEYFNIPAANCWNAVFIPDLLGALDEWGLTAFQPGK